MFMNLSPNKIACSGQFIHHWPSTRLRHLLDHWKKSEDGSAAKTFYQFAFPKRWCTIFVVKPWKWSRMKKSICFCAHCETENYVTYIRTLLNVLHAIPLPCSTVCYCILFICEKSKMFPECYILSMYSKLHWTATIYLIALHYWK